MTESGARLLKDALNLPIRERAHLAAELTASINGARDEDAESAWAAEIDRREAQALRGLSRGLSWNTAIRDIRKNLPRR